MKNLLALFIAMAIMFPAAWGESIAPRAAGGYSIFAETMADMTWIEIEQAAEEQAIVLLPIGVIEEHGPHIACGSDIYLAYLQCRVVRAELERSGIPAIIAPPFYWGINHSTRNFPGSFDIKPETMKALLNDIFANLTHWGFAEVIAINLHGEWGHNQAILECARDAKASIGINVRWVASGPMAGRYGLTGAEDFLLLDEGKPPEGGPQVDGPDFHAGAHETGDIIAFFPELADSNLARKLGPPEVTGGGYQKWGRDARAVTPMGYAGTPSAFDAEWSENAFTQDCMNVARAIVETYRRQTE